MYGSRLPRRSPLIDLAQEQFAPRGLDMQPQNVIAPQFSPLPPTMPHPTLTEPDINGTAALSKIGIQRALGALLKKKPGSLEKYKSTELFYPGYM